MQLFAILAMFHPNGSQIQLAPGPLAGEGGGAIKYDNDDDNGDGDQEIPCLMYARFFS